MKIRYLKRHEQILVKLFRDDRGISPFEPALSPSEQRFVQAKIDEDIAAMRARFAARPKA